MRTWKRSARLSNPSKQARTNRTGFVSGGCPHIGKQEGELWNLTWVGRQREPTPRGQSSPGSESVALAPRTSHLRLGLWENTNMCHVLPKTEAVPHGLGCFAVEWACFSAMSFLVLSGRSVGRFFSHTWSEWVLVNLPLVESTCFPEHWVLLRDQRMRQEHRRLPGDW